MHRFLCGHKFLFLWHRFAGVGFLDCMVNICLVFLIAKLFSEVAVPLSTSILNSERSSFFAFSQAFGIVIFFNLVVLIGVWWYFIVVSICSPLIANNGDCLLISTCQSCILFVKCLCMAFAHFLIRVFVDSWIWRVFYISKAPHPHWGWGASM